MFFVVLGSMVLSSVYFHAPIVGTREAKKGIQFFPYSSHMLPASTNPDQFAKNRNGLSTPLSAHSQTYFFPALAILYRKGSIILK